MDFNLRWDAMTFGVAAVAAAGALVSLGRVRGNLSWLRVPAYGLLLWFALEPAVEIVPSAAAKPALAVLMDVSRSMGIEDPGPRLSEAKELVRKTQAALSEEYDLSYYEFSQDSAKSNYKKILAVSPYGSKTDLCESLRQIFREKKNDKPAALVFSDGAQTPGVSLDLPLDAPVFTVGLGHPGNLKDISVREVRGVDFAFKNRPVELAVRLSQAGFRGVSIPVLLSERKGNELRRIAVREASFSESSSETEVVLKFTPSAVGQMDYRVEVPLQKGEVSRQNNAVDFQMQVQREKLRVLYLCGQPSPEYAFLRSVLKSDPLIDLVSFVILRNPENAVPVPEDQLSLIPFPVHDIFSTSLPEFDLMIFENFSYQRFGITPAYLENVRHFVETLGGGFLMIGGENSYGKGGYAGTPIDAILPFQIGASAEAVDDSDSSVRILEPRHPILSMADAPAETERVWSALPPTGGKHRLPGVKPGATLLAVFQDGGSPAMACWQKGRGRVLALGTLSTWRWALGVSEKGMFQSSYTQFWRQALRWLVGSGDAQILRIVLSEPQWLTGRKSSLKVILQADRLRGGKDSQPSVRISGPDGSSHGLALTAAGQGEYRAEWTPSSEGEYRISAEIQDGIRTIREARTVSARAVDWEKENPAPDHGFLKDIAQKSGGTFFTAEEFSPDSLKGRIQPSGSRPVRSVSRSLWAHPGLLALLLVLLLCEWGIRRWRGGF
jgi:uncharacterized membrane protein